MKNSKSYESALREMRKKRPDVSNAKALLGRALRAGDSRAAYALATWHLHGVHLPKNLGKALTLLRLAAKDHVAAACYDLAVCFERGAGVRKSEKKAYENFLMAALWGDKQSIYEVGRCQYYGIGTKRHRSSARIWLERAKSLGLS